MLPDCIFILTWCYGLKCKCLTFRVFLLRNAHGHWYSTVQVWNAGDGGNVFTYHGLPGSVGAVAWSPSGQRIACGSDQTVQVWNAADGGNVFTYSGYHVNAVAWSPNGQRIASGSDDGTVQVWEAK